MAITVDLGNRETITVKPVGDLIQLTYEIKKTGHQSQVMVNVLLTIDQANTIGFAFDQSYTEIDMHRERTEFHIH